MSASVLCFAVAPGGELFFLLGKQARSLNGRPTRVSDTWCDFGGHVMDTDGGDLAVTAAREFWEESMCCVNVGIGTQHCDSLAQRSAALAHSLRCGNHVAAITLGERQGSVGHVCYVRQIPWAPAAPRTFKWLRKYLLAIRDTSKTCAWMCRRFPEVCALSLVEQWLYCTVARTSTLQKPIVTAVIAHSHNGDYGLLHADGVDRTYTVSFLQASTGATDTVTAQLPSRLSPSDVANFVRYLHKTQLTHTQWQALPPQWRTHPALRVTWWRGRVIRMTVSRHFLEMQSIAWWGLPRLLALAQHTGRLLGAVIRPCFLPTIRITLDHLAWYHATHTSVFCSRGQTESYKKINVASDSDSREILIEA